MDLQPATQLRRELHTKEYAAYYGESAGQTIFHCHIHLIPRRDGDTPEPRGGVRGVIPERRGYFLDFAVNSNGWCADF